MSLHVEVAVLNKISHLVARRTSITEMLQEVLKILHVEMGLIRGTVTLREGDVLVIEASEGLSRSEIDRGLYRVGEGITGLVAAQGKGRIIPDISKEKGFLNRTKARDNQVGVAFVCVPIIYKDDVIGTLSIDRKVCPDTDLKADYHLLDTIANIMADAIFAAYSAHEEREKLESEKLKTQRLLEELRQVKTSDAAEIMRLKKELKTVRAVLRTYVIQIDSLNRLNAALKQENEEVKNKYSAATVQITNLSQEKETLHQKVSLAAQLDATNVTVQTQNKRGRNTSRVKNVKKIAVTFTIVKNITAETGNKTIYVRIAKPDNSILTKSDANRFKYEDREIGYSIKKYIEYTGEEQTVTVYWDVEEFLPAGEYHIYIFADGNMIGQGAFSMK